MTHAPSLDPLTEASVLIHLNHAPNEANGASTDLHKKCSFASRAGGLGAAAETSGVPLESDAAYTCPACFETNYVAVDPTAGRRQRFGEDCPVCCRPISFQVEIDREGDPIVISAELDD